MGEPTTLYPRLFPLEDVADPALRLQLQLLKKSWEKDHPSTSIPPILVPLWTEDSKGGVGDGGRIMAAVNEQGGTPAFFVPRLYEVPEYMGIIVHPDSLRLLTGKENLFFIAHEAGHYFLRHTAMLMSGMPAKSLECAADQFAAHYVGEGDATLLSAARRWFSRSRSGRDPGLMELEFFNWLGHSTQTHPAPVDRIRMMAQDAVVSLKPGSIAFDNECHGVNLTQPAVPSPAYNALRQKMQLSPE